MSTKVSVLWLALALSARAFGSRYIDMNEHRSKQWGDTRQLTHNITLYFTCLAVMLADQRKVSPWINADPSVGFSSRSGGNGGNGGGGGGETNTRSDDNVTRCSVTSQDTGNLCWSGGAAAVISAKTSTAHSPDILRAKLTLLQCVVCARSRGGGASRASENERGVQTGRSRAAARSRTHTRSAHGIPTVKIYARDKLQIVPLREGARVAGYRKLEVVS